MKYDYLIVGSGLFGSVFAHEATKRRKKCLVIEKRNHIGGNIYTENVNGITVHKYGAHIFHTSNEEIWNYVNSISEFNSFRNCPIVNYKGRFFNLPFNMNTFNQLWGVKTPEEAKIKIEEQRAEFLHIIDPKNLEEQALALVGRDIYYNFIKGYSEKQWGRPANKIPAFIIRRIPIRFTYDNNYFNDSFQGIPVGGYTQLISSLLKDVEIRTNVDFFKEKAALINVAKTIVYTGKIDEYFDYRFGNLEYRSLYFKNELLDISDFQSNAVVNYTDADIPFTRIIEHKHFESGKQDKTYITTEYPDEFSEDKEPYYPINDERNQNIFFRYHELAEKTENVIFGGRLAEFKYYDMHQVVERALSYFKPDSSQC